MPACEHCKAWVPDNQSDQDEPIIGECRFLPPVSNLPPCEISGAVNPVWPKTNNDDYCLKFIGKGM